MEGNGCSLHNSVPRFRASGWGRGGKRARVLNPKVRTRKDHFDAVLEISRQKFLVP